nr:chemotaxis protein CheB [uncultured Desulfobulbus sp.]
MQKTHEQCTYEAVVIGVSAGGLAALDRILPRLHSPFSVPILIVQHIGADSDSYLPTHFDIRCAMTVKEAEDKERIQGGKIYFAPPNYHLMVEQDRSIALSIDEKVNYSRPSIDVLFETAAITYRQNLIGVVLTGANNDGARGLARIKRYGGLTIVQDPDSAEVDTMPKAALEATDVDRVLPLEEIAVLLNKLCAKGER